MKVLGIDSLPCAAALVVALSAAASLGAQSPPIPPAPNLSRPQVPDLKVGFGTNQGGGPEAEDAATPVAPAAPVVAGEEAETESDGESAEPAGGNAGGPGILGRLARGLFSGGKENGEPAPGGEEDAANAEGREALRKTKEFVGLALRNIEKQRVSEAKKNLNDLITLKPYEPDFHLALGLCFRKEKRYKDAQKKYQDVLDLGGPRSLVNLLMAEVAADGGNKEKVFEYLKEAAVGGRNIVHDVQNLPLLDKYKGDTEFIKLALYLEKFELRSRAGQDPFTNPFPAAQTGPSKQPLGVPVDLGAGSRPWTGTEQQTFLAESRRVFEKILWYIKLEDDEKAMENYIRLREKVEQKDRITLPKLQNDFRILIGRMEDLEVQIEGIRLKYYWKQANGRLAELKEAFHAQEYNRVDSLFADVEKLAKEMEKANVRFKPVAERVLTAGKVWMARAAVRREFQTAKPDIQGVVIAEEAKLAIIENRIFKQGESFGDFQIQKVENNRVTFRYKGEEIPLIFRRY